VLGWVTSGAIAVGVAGLTGGLAAGTGAGALTVGAVSGFTGDAIEQLLATGTIDPQRLAAATLTGGVLGWAGGRLASRLVPRMAAATPHPLPGMAGRGGLRSTARGGMDRPTRAACPSHSFDPTTPVLMADGRPSRFGTWP